MEIFTESYNDLIKVATSVLQKKGRPLLYEAMDVVHEVYLQAGADDTLDALRKKVYYTAMTGIVYSCAEYYYEGDFIAKPSPIWSGLEEKWCPKCKTTKLLAKEFYVIHRKRVGVGYYTYSKYCRACEPRGVWPPKNSEKRREKQNKKCEQLSDKYITGLIKQSLINSGVKVTMRTITPQMIALKRMQIIEKRIIQVNKRNKQNG